LHLIIADSRPEASIRFVKSVFCSVEHLIDFPEASRIVPEFGDPCIREIVRKPCRIVYRIKSKKGIIEVVRAGTPQGEYPRYRAILRPDAETG